ncbi:MAG TPA: nucleotide disphospho-sugar-binding domain-containing protein [Polyangiaceae bacterium]|nr:nucleotide disphospho-sugar-binding domain-containing protein [Polyangiaceae bacterium]
MVPVFTVDRDITMDVARKGTPPSLSWWKNVCDQSVASDLQALEKIKPDAVVADMRWSMSTSARAFGVPYVAIANACWTDRFAQQIEVPEGHITSKFLGKWLAKAAFPMIEQLLMKYGAMGYKEVRRKYGMGPLRSMWEAVEGDITLMPDLPEFMPVVRDTSPTFRYIGPLLWDANMGLPSWFSKLQPGRPTIYFTMGSTGDTKFFEEAVRVFGNTEFQVLITTGGLAEIPNPPSNVFIAKYAPGDALMAVSDVVVSHGGNGTVYQALSCGVPVIGFPTMFDQEINMRQVEALGIGIQMSNKQYSGPSLDRAVRKVISETRYRERCRQLAARISRMDGRRRAALHIHDFLQHKDPKEHPVTATAILQLLPPLGQESAVA